MIRLMEQFERQEVFPKREEIIEIIHRVADKAVLVREENDEHGPYLIVMIDSSHEDCDVIYKYMRKGDWQENGSSVVTSISRYLPSVSGIELDGVVAVHDDFTGEWKFVEQDEDGESEDGGSRWTP